MSRSSWNFPCLSAVMAVLCTPGVLLAQSYQTIPSMPLSTFQSSLGVVVQMEYTDSTYANASAVLSDLQFVGIRNVRDYTPNPSAWQPAGQGLAAVRTLAAAGIQFDFLIDGNYSLSTQMQQLDQLAQQYPGVVRSVEGPNEINNFPVTNVPAGETEEQAAEAIQRQIYSAVHSDSNLSGVPVYYLTGGAPIDLSANPGLADLANGHPYPHDGQQPYNWITNEFTSHFTMPGQYPKAITETGYYTLPQSKDWGGVDQPAQAEMMLNDYFDAALQGTTRTFAFMLEDAYADPNGSNINDHFGFFDINNSPKIIAYAMHHIADVLPTDAASSPVSVQAAISGLPSTAHTLALTKSDGSVVLFLWNEAPVWNLAQEILQLITPVPVTVQMNGSWNVSYFTPAEDGTFPVAGLNGSYLTYVSSYPTALIFSKK